MTFIRNDLIIGGKQLSLVAKKMRQYLIKHHNAKEFYFKTNDRFKLSGMFIERKNPTATLLLCHGYQCCKELMTGYIHLFPTYNALIFDFRAHGQSEGIITTAGCHEYKDVLAAVNWFKKNKPQLSKIPLVILGVSMGGAAALKATEFDQSLGDGFIIDSSFSSMNSILYNTFAYKSGLPTFPFLYIMKKMLNYFGKCDINTMKPVDSITKIKKPLLLIHSCVDSLVPVQESLLMYAQVAKTGAKLWIGPKCKHGWLHKKHPKPYKKKINKFIKKYVCNR